MKPQPSWPGFLAGSSLVEGVLRLPISPNSDPSLCPGVVRMPERHGCSRPSPALSASRCPPTSPSPHSFGSGSLGAEQRTRTLEPFRHLSREPTPSPPGLWAAGRPETPRNSRAPRTALHLFKFVITGLSVSAASRAPVRARCGVLLSPLRAFLGSVPALGSAVCFGGGLAGRLLDHGVSLIS